MATYSDVFSRTVAPGTSWGTGFSVYYPGRVGSLHSVAGGVGIIESDWAAFQECPLPAAVRSSPTWAASTRLRWAAFPANMSAASARLEFDDFSGAASFNLSAEVSVDASRVATISLYYSSPTGFDTSASVPAGVVAASAWGTLRLEWSSATATLRAEYWTDGTPEPGWLVETTGVLFNHATLGPTANVTVFQEVVSPGLPDGHFEWSNFSAGNEPFYPPGSAPVGLSGAPEYAIELFNSDATFGPNTKLGEIWDARNIGWSRYDRLSGKAFFTLAQTSPALALLVPLTTHVAIYRIAAGSQVLVYRGIVADTNSTGDDVVVDCWDYVSLLSVSRSGFKTLYPTKKLGSEIVSPEWVAAKSATNSPLGFVTTGTIEDPLGADEVTFIKTNTQFGTLDQTRMQLFYDLTEMGRANTVHHTTFEIDLNNTFNFWKNRGSASTMALVLGGNISDYQYQAGWTRYRNDIATIGTGSAGGASEIVSTNAGEIASKGLRQDVATLKTLAGISGGTTEADQQKAALDRMLRKLYQQQPGLAVRAERGKLEPFVGFSLNDTVSLEIANGNDLITGVRRVIGLRCLFSEAGEDVDVVLALVAT